MPTRSPRPVDYSAISPAYVPTLHRLPSKSRTVNPRDP
jgi:hypothetical protein